MKHISVLSRKLIFTFALDGLECVMKRLRLANSRKQKKEPR